ncbi:MAG: restriction endonuclease subunit S [candidate division Zixibacteria bacterium]
MMASKKPLSEVTTFISRGISPKYDENGYVVINQRCIREQRVDFSRIRFSDSEKTSVKPEKFVCQWDGLVNSTGVGTLGRVAQILKPVNSTIVDSHVTIVRPDLEQLDGRYFGYALFDAEKYIETLGEGATGQTELARGRLSEVDIRVPSLSTQRKIAAILSAYDDLIENNLQRIKILEEMAQNLYREWFVKFRFPGHQHARFTDSPLGRIPEGWEVKALGSLIAEHIGGGWGKDVADERHTVPAWVIRGTDIPDARFCNCSKVPFRYHTTSNLKSRCLMPGDIIFEVSGGSKDQPLGRSLLISSELFAAFNGDSVICASFCKRIRPDSQQYASELLYLSFLDAYVSGEIEQYQVQSTGISNFKWSDYLEKVNRCVPPADLQERFCDLCVPLFSEIATFGRKNTTLRRTRDLLLPKLISGEIDVLELDIAFPEEVEI